MRFNGKVLFATGAASGIGAATARRFAAEGGRVAVVDLARDRADALAAELDGSIGIGCDVSDEASVGRAVAESRDRLGRLDCVLCGAGHAQFGPIEQFSLDHWNRMLAVHLTGTFLVCKAVLPALRAAGGGAIVNIASTAALIGRKNLAAYSAAKGGILALSRQLAVDFVADNIRVNAVAPGSVRSGLTDPLYVQRGEGDFQKGLAMAAADILQKRVGEAEEVAAPICFLLSDDASFITGSYIVPDGGMTAI